MLEAVGHGVACGFAVYVAFSHTTDQENLVVHGQAEDDADQHDGEETDERLRVADQSSETLLPDEHGKSESCRHGECKSEGGNQRHPDRTEDQHEQNECEAEYDGEVGEQGVVKPLGDVLEHGANTGDLVVVGVVAQVVQQVAGAFIGGTVLGGDQDLCGVLGVVKCNDLCVAYAVGSLQLFDGRAKVLHALILRCGGGIDHGDHGAVAAWSLRRRRGGGSRVR